MNYIELDGDMIKADKISKIGRIFYDRNNKAFEMYRLNSHFYDLYSSDELHKIISESAHYCVAKFCVNIDGEESISFLESSGECHDCEQTEYSFCKKSVETYNIIKNKRLRIISAVNTGNNVTCVNCGATYTDGICKYCQ
jgi:hypothetical protein